MSTRSTQPTRILVVGRGGREFALAWKLASDPGINDVYVTNAGTAVQAIPHVRAVGGNPESPVEVVAAARRISAELVVIGPEAALAAGVVDALIDAGIPVFGPTAAAARIESSKAFCREVSEAAGVPMARGRAFAETDPSAALAYAMGLATDGRVVVKADGLAAGKGVTVCDTLDEAAAAISMQPEAFIVEERLVGREASVVAVCDGRDAIALPVARDHKRLGDGDTGPNTGGMGAYSPVPDLSDADAVDIVERFHRPVLAELARRGTPFRGALYAGIMLTDDGPRLLEFNARFGDPETQVTVPRIATPLGPLLAAAAAGDLGPAMRRFDDPRVVPALPIATVGIVLASAGYPGPVANDGRITALDETAMLPDAPGVLVFHSGTAHEIGSGYLATGGRVLTVVATGPDLGVARERAEAAADRIAWPGAQRRHDIGLIPAGVGA